ncbi:MAG TPA: glycogen/starch/alpha-glucan family phosphorylase [Chitinivibrionales bacterium]|nr:glycogen/starch/alpha-glucan family phosphorylase [Chitinivibrionales bacterium]
MESLKLSYHRYLRYFLAKDDTTATPYDKFLALSYAVRSELVDRWIETQRRYHGSELRRIYFFSMEYIFGRSLRQNVLSLDIEEDVAAMAKEFGFSTDELYEEEDSFDLGNGGKARLAACLQDAMAAAGLPAMAYGLRYDYGQFRQCIENGAQVERPYDWLHKGHPWEIVRPQYSCVVNYYGRAENARRPDNPLAGEWKDAERVVAVPFDFPVAGFKNCTVNTLRLWSAEAAEEFLPDYANHQDYLRACEDKSRTGTITKVLFPDEDVLRATELRLKQQFFLVSASLHDILRRFKQTNESLAQLGEKVAIQLNGSNCALAVPELMRCLVDLENIPFRRAWDITTKVFAYTSNAVSRDHLEAWPVYLMNQVFPRHMQIIYEINQLHLDKVREKIPFNNDLIRDLSLIAEGEVKRVKLGHLAALTSYVVNGVSVAQTGILKTAVFPEFMAIAPDKFLAKTNGVSHRRWLLCSNRPLGDLISKTIGDGWIKNPEELSNLEPHAGDAPLLEAAATIRLKAKKILAAYILAETGVEVDPEAMFDVQCKKIHLYKRQVLHVLNILSRYLRIKGGEALPVRRVHVFSGKAAPADQLAKQVIRLITIAADVINGDAQIGNAIKVVFLPDYGVSLAERIVPAADLSEQIATPGQEASGTGNTKFAINGGLLMASKSGSNIEIIERTGAENVFVFGRSAQELPSVNRYQPYDILSASPVLSGVFRLLQSLLEHLPQNTLSIRPLLSTLMDSDRYFVLLDFDDYVRRQNDADTLYTNKKEWTKRGLVNIARCGYFSIDRTTKEYARDIWRVNP